MSILMSVISNNTTTDPTYSYSFKQSYGFPTQVMSYRLKQNYFVSEWTARDLRYDTYKKHRLDE